MAGNDKAKESLDLFVEIFGIEDELQEELAKQVKKNSTSKKINKNEVSFPMLDSMTTI